MNITLTKVYAAIVAIPVGAILLASVASGGSNSYDYDDSEPRAPRVEHRDDSTGSSVTEAEAYGALGKYNPCIFIECDGE